MTYLLCGIDLRLVELLTTTIFFICQKKEIELITALKEINLDGQKSSQNSNKLNGLSNDKKT